MLRLTLILSFFALSLSAVSTSALNPDGPIPEKVLERYVEQKSSETLRLQVLQKPGEQSYFLGTAVNSFLVTKEETAGNDRIHWRIDGNYQGEAWVKYVILPYHMGWPRAARMQLVNGLGNSGRSLGEVRYFNGVGTCIGFCRKGFRFRDFKCFETEDGHKCWLKNSLAVETFMNSKRAVVDIYLSNDLDLLLPVLAVIMHIRQGDELVHYTEYGKVTPTPNGDVRETGRLPFHHRVQ